MQGPIPSCALRSLQLTASFESHGFGLAMGNFDGALLTWGIIGFTLKHDKVSSIVLAVNDSFPERIQEAFGASASELLSLMRASKAEQESWADEHTLSNGRLAEPWKKMFATFGSFPEVQQEQLKRVQSDYMQPAIKTAKRLGFKSELGLALCFDIHVQNGGIKKAAMEQVRSQSSSNQRESDLRQVVANAVANAAGQKYREDVRRRKLTVARGTGRVHGHDYVLANWGINEQFVADEVGA